METYVRAIVAAAALAHARRQKVSSIYAYQGGGYINVDVTVDEDRVTGYDYTNGCHFDGNMPNLFHYGVGSHVEFHHRGDGRYPGYDYSSGSHFEVTVRGSSAEIYDYGSGGWFSYST